MAKLTIRPPQQVNLRNEVILQLAKVKGRVAECSWSLLNSVYRCQNKIFSVLLLQIRHLEVSRHAFEGLIVTGSFLLKDVVMRTVVSLAFRFVMRTVVSLAFRFVQVT